MIKNYIIIAWRSLTKNKVFSLINMFGLAVGFGLLHAYSGLFVPGAQLRYLFAQCQAALSRKPGPHSTTAGTDTYPVVDIAVGEGMKNAYPEIQASTRLSANMPVFVENGSKNFKESNLLRADSNFLQLFGIPLVEGDAKRALVDPRSIVITREMAKKYFGDGTVLGQTLIVAKQPMKVTGIINKVPNNTHFHGDAFISLNTFTEGQPQTWSNVGFYTYLLLRPGTDPKKLEARFPDLVAKYVVPEIQHDMGISLAEAQKAVGTFLFTLQPVTDIHLYSHTKFEREANGDINYVYIFGALAAFILVLACINFTNLSTAASARRSKEVGIRKVLGSLKGNLISQFLTESVLLTFLAMAIGLGIVYFMLPYFKRRCR